MFSGPGLELCQASHDSGDEGCSTEEREEDSYNESLDQENAYLQPQIIRYIKRLHMGGYVDSNDLLPRR